jgi:hypothetical protein
VFIFELDGHMNARVGYAWSIREHGGTRYIAVAGIPPIDSPAAAVQAATEHLLIARI